MKNESIIRLVQAGIGLNDAQTLRREAMILHRWHELECGTEHGGIERDEITRKVFFVQAQTGKRFRYADRETGALRRINEVLEKYRQFVPYVQGDPRAAALFIVRRKDVPKGGDINSYYSRGIAVYK